LWFIVKVHILNETQSIVFKNVSTLKTSFGAKPNVLQFCPLSDFYVVNVIQPLCTLLMFNRFIHVVKVFVRLEEFPLFNLFKAVNLAILNLCKNY